MPNILKLCKKFPIVRNIAIQQNLAKDLFVGEDGAEYSKLNPSRFRVALIGLAQSGSWLGWGKLSSQPPACIIMGLLACQGKEILPLDKVSGHYHCTLLWSII